jgi:hypothetical protein
MALELRDTCPTEYECFSTKPESLKISYRREICKRFRRSERMLKNLSGKTATVTGSSRYAQDHCEYTVTERTGASGQE